MSDFSKFIEVPEGCEVALKIYAIHDDGRDACVTIAVRRLPINLFDTLNPNLAALPPGEGDGKWRLMTKDEIEDYKDYLEDEITDDYCD